MAQEMRSPRIDAERLRALFDGLNAFGRSASGSGYSRPAFSDADMDARNFIADEMEAAGLEVRRDAAGTVVGRWGEEGLPAIVVGSHLDTVAEGGAFAGTLGVAIALEAVRAMRADGIEPQHPIEVVATSDQEGRFGFMLGAQAMAGTLDRDRVARAADTAGVALGAAMSEQGLDAERLSEAARPAGSLKAFIEFHVEQGPQLEEQGASVGIVETAGGQVHWRVTLTGKAAHAAGVPMAGRTDALAGFAEIAATIPSVIRIVGREEARVSLANVTVLQKSLNTVPTSASFDLLVYDTDDKRMRTITSAFRALVKRTAEARGLEFSIEEIDASTPLPFDAELADMLEEEAGKLGLQAVRLSSVARRDASVMQAVCPSALVLLPSREGAGLSAEERTDWSDVEDGARLMLAALMRLSGFATEAAEETDGEDAPQDAPDDSDEPVLGPFLGGALAAGLADEAFATEAAHPEEESASESEDEPDDTELHLSEVPLHGEVPADEVAAAEADDLPDAVYDETEPESEPDGPDAADAGDDPEEVDLPEPESDLEPELGDEGVATAETEAADAEPDAGSDDADEPEGPLSSGWSIEPDWPAKPAATEPDGEKHAAGDEDAADDGGKHAVEPETKDDDLHDFDFDFDLDLDDFDKPERK